MYDILISGYYGFENSGDDAILMAILDHLHSCKQDIKILVLSKNPEETRKIYGVDAANRFNFNEVMRAMKESKLFLTGGGNLIQDESSTRSLMYYLTTIYLAKKLGLKVMLYSNGIGAVHKKINRIITSRIINKADVITLREEASLKEIESLKVTKPKVLVTADPAFTLLPCSEDETSNVFAAEGIKKDRPFVAISIRKWKNAQVYSKQIAAAADYMYEKYGIQPVLIPMHYPHDVEISDTIASLMRHSPYIIRNKYSVPQTLGIIKNMDMIIGMRLHALIYGVSLQVPVIGLIYDSKVEGFLEYAKQPSAGHVENLDYETLIRTIDHVWNNRQPIIEQLTEAKQLFVDKAIQNAEIAVNLLK
ncbi:MAG: polysaccharide pyruvyl transferase CsaB [Clostridiales bacterium GWB2_37_7]|nr:MAG: polysaccharide pyruvyl transferase CsaB [Clostridiales bacterium GWB2_37_7]